MTESDHHHHQGGLDPAIQPVVFQPPAEQYTSFRDDQYGLPYQAYGSRRAVRPGWRPRAGGPGWVLLWIVRLAFLALFASVAFYIIHGMTSMGSSVP